MHQAAGPVSGCDRIDLGWMWQAIFSRNPAEVSDRYMRAVETRFPYEVTVSHQSADCLRLSDQLLPLRSGHQPYRHVPLGLAEG